MGQHCPEAAKGLGRNPWTKLHNVAFQIGSDKITSPLEPDVVTGCQKATWKAASDPKRLNRWRVDLQGAKRTKLQIGDASPQALARLLQQVHFALE